MAKSEYLQREEAAKKQLGAKGVRSASSSFLPQHINSCSILLDLRQRKLRFHD